MVCAAVCLVGFCDRFRHIIIVQKLFNLYANLEAGGPSKPRYKFRLNHTNLQKIQIANVLNWMQTCTEGLQGYSRSKIKPLIFCVWDISPALGFLSNDSFL